MNNGVFSKETCLPNSKKTFVIVIIQLYHLSLLIVLYLAVLLLLGRRNYMLHFRQIGEIEILIFYFLFFLSSQGNPGTIGFPGVKGTKGAMVRTICLLHLHDLIPNLLLGQRHYWHSLELISINYHK